MASEEALSFFLFFFVSRDVGARRRQERRHRQDQDGDDGRGELVGLLTWQASWIRPNMETDDDWCRYTVQAGMEVCICVSPVVEARHGTPVERGWLLVVASSRFLLLCVSSSSFLPHCVSIVVALCLASGAPRSSVRVPVVSLQDDDDDDEDDDECSSRWLTT